MEIVGGNRLEILLERRLEEAKDALSDNNQEKLYTLLRMGNLYFVDVLEIKSALFEQHTHVSGILDEITDTLRLGNGGKGRA